jgi:amino acid transporter
MGTWEILLFTNFPALLDGGLAGLWWQMIWCYIGQTFIVLSLSEMSSMAPTAGGQYHWVSINNKPYTAKCIDSSKVSEFAPPSLQKILSYYSGWLSMLAWQAFVPANSYICAALVQALIVLNDPTHVPQPWQTTLLMIAFVSGMAAFNVFFARQLAFIEGFFAVLHFVAWIAIVAVLWAMTPVKQDAKTVFTDFTGKLTYPIPLQQY